MSDLAVACSTLQATVSTLAGSGNRGSANSTGTDASFFLPKGAAVDSSGNVYVADWANHQIRKITPAGVVSLMAGTAGVAGSTNGPGPAAQFNLPSGLTVDASGNVYVADTENHLIRKITPWGVVSTLAGAGTRGSADGTGTAAYFTFPRAVAVDDSGNVYVADGNNMIRKITPAGVVSTLAGTGTPGSDNGPGTTASFSLPAGVAVDARGNVYVADWGNNLIRKITPAGVVSTLAGSGAQGSGNGPWDTASFNVPQGVAVDAGGNVYVADQNNNLIRKITPARVVSTLAGTAGVPGSANGAATAASFQYPTGLAVDADGNVYVADTNNNLIRKITPAPGQ